MASPGLPPRCVVKIIKEIDNVHDLMNCLRVCRQWRRIAERVFANVRYLVRRAPEEPEDSSLETKKMHTLYFIDLIVFQYWQLSELCPNLSIIDTAGPRKLTLTREDVEGLYGASEVLKGIIYRLSDIPKFCVNDGCPFVSMVSLYYLSSQDAQYLSEIKLMQLHTEECFLDTVFAHSLIRLHIGDTLGGIYDAAYLDNLKILEISTLVTAEDGYYNGFSLINRCPNLQSLYLKIDGLNNSFTFSASAVSYNGNVRDLVIESPYCEWNLIKRILNKYPRIKNLAIRENFRIDDTCVPQIIAMLPDLILIDLRGSYNITRVSEAYVINYRGFSNFPTFYYRQNSLILLEWHDFSTAYERIVKGFSFMKYCFIKSFDHLPYLMDPFV